MALELSLRQGIKRRGLPVETSLIATCCVCGLVRARKAFTLDPDRWVTKRTYEKTYGVTLAGSPFTHTYCSGCHTDFMQRVKSGQQARIASSVGTYLEDGR